MYKYFSVLFLSLLAISTLLAFNEPVSAYAAPASFPSFCNGNTYTSNYNTLTHKYYYGHSTNYNTVVYLDVSPYDVHIDVISNNSTLDLTAVTNYPFMFYPSSVDVPDQLNIIASSAFTICMVPPGYLTPVVIPTTLPTATLAPTSTPIGVPGGCVSIPTYDSDGTYWRTIVGIDSSYDGWYLDTLTHPVNITYNTTGASAVVSGYNIPLDSSVETVFTLSSVVADVGAFLCPFSIAEPTAEPVPTYSGVGIPAGCVSIPTYDSDGTYWRTIVGIDSSYDGWYLNTLVHPVSVTYNTTGASDTVSGYNILIDSNVETLYTLSSLVTDVNAFLCPSPVTEPTSTPIPGGSGGLTSAQVKAAVRDVLTSGTALPITAPSPVVGLATPVPLTTPVPNMSTAVALLCSKEPCYSGSTVLSGMGTLGDVLSLSGDAADCTTLSFSLGSNGFLVGGASMTESVCAFLDWSTSIRYYTRTFSLLIFGFILFRYVQLTVRRVGDV